MRDDPRPDTTARPTSALRSYKIWLLVFLAAICLYLAAYPFIRKHFTPAPIEVAQLQRAPGQILSASWCIPFDGQYNVEAAFQVESYEQRKNLLALLGSGGYTAKGSYKINQKGIDIPISVVVSNADSRIALDTSGTYPTVSRHSHDYVSRDIGKLNIPRGCYQASINVGELSNGLQAYRASVRIHVEKPTGVVGRAVFIVFGYSDWLVAILYSIHLRPALWVGFVLFVLAIVITLRQKAES